MRYSYRTNWTTIHVRKIVREISSTENSVRADPRVSRETREGFSDFSCDVTHFDLHYIYVNSSFRFRGTRVGMSIYMELRST